MILPLTLALTLSPQCEGSNTPEQRAATYEIIRETCAEQGVSPDVCLAAQAVAWRESRGNRCARHTLGKGEDGNGPFGQAWKFWGWTLRPTGLGRVALHDPRLATLGLFREWQYAIRRGARNLRDLQRVHSGHSPKDDRYPARDARWCHLLEHGPKERGHLVDWSGVDCMAEVTADDLGERLTDQRMAEMAAKERE